MKNITINRLDFCERTIVLEGKPFSLKDYPMYKQIYRNHYPEMLMKCGRQVGKTVTEAILIAMESVATPGFRHLYVSPSLEQTRRFSISKLGKIVSGSKKLKPILMQTGIRANVFHKLWSNMSEVFLSYAGDNPDRVRGISADRLGYDEVQDIPLDEVIPVINEVLSASEHGYITYAGTPKTMENTIEFLWQTSKQGEWVIKCDGCNKYSYYDRDSGLGKKGIICIDNKCGKYLNPYNGQWVFMNPDGDFESFHIPQVILPRNNPICATTAVMQEKYERNWIKILRKKRDYGESKFMNEVMGVSSSQGARLIYKHELEAACTDYIPTRPPYNFNPRHYRIITAGIDWGGNGSRLVSRTVLWIWGLTYDGKLETLYFKIYPIENPVDSLEDIKRALGEYCVHAVGADAGEGTLANPILRSERGYENVYPIRYLPQKKPLVWDPEMHQGCYKANRTTLIDNFAMLLKKGTDIRFPTKDVSEPAFKDVLNVFESVTKEGRKFWDRHPAMPDDCLHAMIFGWVAMKIRTQDISFYE